MILLMKVGGNARDQIHLSSFAMLVLLISLQPDDWIAVDMGSTWYPGQFVEFDSEQEELQVNFLQRSLSNPKWFVWPLLQVNGEEDKAWVTEISVFYRLNIPTEGRRETLIFENYDEVDKAFNEIQS